jgi:LysM repeat protein
MSQGTNQPASGVRTQVGAAVLLILTFALIGFVALSVVTGNDFGLGDVAPAANPRAGEPQPAPLGTPDQLGMTSFKQTALGFSLQYPRSWRKNEQGLRVVLSPSADGLSPENLRDAAIWFGIPADGSADPASLLNRLPAELFPNAKLTTTVPTRIGGEQWQSVQLEFDSETMGPVQATVAAASRDEVGYFMVAAAPADRWESLQPVYKNILDSFEFTTQAVLRPTDATPPPTPTPTPTPVFHIVQSGDTLSHVSVKFGVSIQAIMDRNGLDENSIIRPGDKLLIPRKRQR